MSEIEVTNHLTYLFPIIAIEVILLVTIAFVGMFNAAFTRDFESLNRRDIILSKMYAIVVLFLILTLVPTFYFLAQTIYLK